jgi:hypothetical protein
MSNLTVAAAQCSSLNVRRPCGISERPQYSAAKAGTVFLHRLFTTSHGSADTLASMGSPAARVLSVLGLIGPNLKERV